MIDRRWGPDLLFVVLWIAAVVPGILATRDAQWPVDDDGFRDIASAQTMREGAWLGDPFYANERAWYSPLVPGIVAAASRVGRSEIPRTFASLGPWLNAFAPLAFYLCVRRLLGGWPAIAATTCFLFLPGRPPTWAGATYTPWLFPSVTAQALAYLCITWWANVLHTPAFARAIAVGIALGLAFLAHTAAAALVAGIIIVTAIVEAWRPSRADGSVDGSSTPPHRVRPLVMLVVTGVTALVLASPFIVPIVVEYRFAMRNRSPAIWMYEAAEPRAVALSMLKLSSVIVLAFAIAGAWWIWRRAGRASRLVIVAWGAVASVLYAYALAAESFTSLPALVPAYHFFFQLRAWQWVLVGAGLMSAIELAAPRLGVSVPRATGVVVILFAVSLYPRYLGRDAFTRAAEKARHIPAVDEAVYRWIRRDTAIGDVFLARDYDAFRIVGPAGRQVVFVGGAFANPYVDNAVRAADQERMWAALAARDHATFESLARRYHVTHIVLRGKAATRASESALPSLTRVFSAADVLILSVDSAETTPTSGSSR